MTEFPSKQCRSRPKRDWPTIESVHAIHKFAHTPAIHTRSESGLTKFCVVAHRVLLVLLSFICHESLAHPLLSSI